MGRVDGKVVLVTGAASGVGKETALLLAREGARLILTDLDEAGVAAVAAEIGAAALAVRHDIALAADWRRVMAAGREAFGQLDALVNNAAILAMGSIEDTTLELWRKIQRTNAEGYFWGCKYGVAALRERGGSIINMASLAALSGMGGFCAYSASKGAVTALTRSVAAHCRNRGYGIRCNSIHPDAVKTPMIMNLAPPPGAGGPRRAQANGAMRMCLPLDVAQLILFLVSDESRYINASQLVIDNGQLMMDASGY